jgi:hypothetical protein
VERNLPRLLLNQETNVLGKGLGLLSDDLTFAEDLLLVSTFIAILSSQS